MRVSTPSPLEEQQVHYFTNQNALDLAFDQATLSFTDNTYEEVVAQGPWPITTYRWRKEYGGLKLNQAKRLKELEKENAKLKRVVAELSLEKQILKDAAAGNF